MYVWDYFFEVYVMKADLNFVDLSLGRHDVAASSGCHYQTFQYVVFSSVILRC